MSVFGLTIEYGIGDGAGDASLQRFQLAMERFGEGLSDFWGNSCSPMCLRCSRSGSTSSSTREATAPLLAHGRRSPKYAKWKEVHFPACRFWSAPVYCAPHSLKTAAPMRCATTQQPS